MAKNNHWELPRNGAISNTLGPGPEDPFLLYRPLTPWDRSHALYPTRTYPIFRKGDNSFRLLGLDFLLDCQLTILPTIKWKNAQCLLLVSLFLCNFDTICICILSILLLSHKPSVGRFQKSQLSTEHGYNIKRILLRSFNSFLLFHFPISPHYFPK